MIILGCMDNCDCWGGRGALLMTTFECVVFWTLMLELAEAFKLLLFCFEKFACLFFMCLANFLVTVSGVGIFISVSVTDLLKLPEGTKTFSLDKVMVGDDTGSFLPP